MAFSGFGKNSGPSAPPGAQNPFGNFPRPPPSSPLPISPRSSIGYRDFDASEGIFSSPLDSSQPFPGTHNNEPPLRSVGVRASSFKYDGAQYQRPSTLLPQVAPGNIRIVTPAKTAEFQSFSRANSSYSQSSDQASNISRRVTESPVDLRSGNKTYSVPYGERLSPLGFQNNLYVGGQHPHREEFHQRPSASVWVNQSKLSSHNTIPPARGISPVLPTGGTYRSGPMSQTKHADGPLPKRTRSPTLPSNTGVSPDNTHSDGHKRSLVHYRDLDAPDDVSSLPLAFESSSSRRDSSRPLTGIQKSFPTSTWADQSKSSINNTAPLVQEDMPSALRTRVAYQSGRKPETEYADIQLPKRTRSPTIPSTNEGFTQNPSVVSDSHKRSPGFQSRSLSPILNQANSAEAAANKPMDFPAVKRSKIPFLSSSGVVSQENLDPAQEIERELQQKAKRLARFKDELNLPVESPSTVQNQKDPAKRQHPSMSEKQKISEDPKMDMMVGSGGGNTDHEGVASLSSIVGICPDMCPESERAERERKGDLDQYERLDGDRNLSSEFLAVKKYTRTAEREPQLIRPMPILQKTMDYLLNLLDESYDDRFLGLYNFLWDRMRAVRMDLRMQHIFNVEAISMLEQMIRLHIIAMHELCEYTKGEGFSEGFDAHLNIEQMNKTSVELFQLYDDHRKNGKHVPSEREFRGYYALLKLDKHPGYKVEPAELSLDLAKMTPEMRQTPEVLFARHVARACRTGNFIAFFRLARKASYLQACLMHAHFSKLRTQALASLHCGLQMNQGIPITHVAKWLGLEEEDVGELLEYYGFSVKDFEEPYMVKENAFLNVDNDFPVRRSKLVERKRSRMIVNDVSYPSLTESYADNKVMEILLKKDMVPRPTPLQSIVPTSTPPPCDEEMHDPVTSLSPKGSMQKPMHKTSIFPTTPDKRTAGVEVQVASPGPLVLDFFNNSSEHHQSGIESSKKFNHELALRNSFGRLTKHDLATPPVTQETAVAQMRAEEKREPVMPLDSVVHISPQPMFSEDLEGEELIGIVEEDMPDEATTSNYDQEVLEAKLRLILRIWKRRTTKKRILREHKQFTANAALNLLSLGPPMWQFEVQSGNSGTFNIDHVMSQRHEVQERSYSVLNPSDVIAAELVKKNPDAKCLCWKLVLCSQDETLHGHNEAAFSAADSWLHSKLMPANNDGADDLLVSSPGLAIWRSWVHSQSGIDLSCCLSVIKNMEFDDVNKSLGGANAVLFLLSEQIPIELQKKRLHDLVSLLPSGSSLPLLVLSGSCKNESDSSNIAKILELHNIDKSRVTTSYITFLKDAEMKRDGYFSDEHLRNGLKWLARDSPPQIVVTRTKTRERVLSHLNTTLEILDQMDTHRVGPNHCISAFNEALDRSMKEIAATALANPTGWPCPEIDLLEESGYEYKSTTWYLPRVGWSSVPRIEALLSALNDSRLPPFEYDLSWLSTGLHICDDIGKQKSRLESCLVDYLTETSQMMNVALARNEAGIVLQNCTSLELHNTAYYISPKWVTIYRRLFNWRLMKLNTEEVSSTYLLEQHYSTAPSFEIPISSPYQFQPSFDELVEVGFRDTRLVSNDMEREDVRPWSPMASNGADVLISIGNIVSVENEETGPQDSTLASYDRSAIGEENPVVHTVVARKSKDTDRLSELLEKCNIVQNLIDDKLSIYF